MLASRCCCLRRALWAVDILGQSFFQLDLQLVVVSHPSLIFDSSIIKPIHTHKKRAGISSRPCRRAVMRETVRGRDRHGGPSEDPTPRCRPHHVLIPSCRCCLLFPRERDTETPTTLQCRLSKHSMSPMHGETDANGGKTPTGIEPTGKPTCWLRRSTARALEEEQHSSKVATLSWVCTRQLRDHGRLSQAGTQRMAAYEASHAHEWTGLTIRVCHGARKECQHT